MIAREILSVGTPPRSRGVPTLSSEDDEVECISTNYFHKGEFVCREVWRFQGDVGWLTVLLADNVPQAVYAPTGIRGVLLRMKDRGWSFPDTLWSKYT